MSADVDAMVRQFVRAVVARPGATLAEARADAGLDSDEGIVAAAFSRAHGLLYTRRDPAIGLQRYYPQPGESGGPIPDDEVDSTPPTGADVRAAKAWLVSEGLA